MLVVRSKLEEVGTSVILRWLYASINLIKLLSEQSIVTKFFCIPFPIVLPTGWTLLSNPKNTSSQHLES